MTTTVWQGTIEAGPVIGNIAGNTIPNVRVIFGFPHNGTNPESVVVDNYLTLTPASGYCSLTGLDLGPLVIEAATTTGQTGTDFSTAWSDADSPPLLFLDPTQAYTLTITTED